MTAAVPGSDRQAEVEAALRCRAGWACPRRTGDGPGPAASAGLRRVRPGRHAWSWSRAW